MSKLFFLTLHPDDYNGYPEVLDLCEDRIPDVPGWDQIFSDWCEAGYNAFYWRKEDSDYDEDNPEHNDEEIYFEEYGNYYPYYAVYLVILNEGQTPEQFKESIEGNIYLEGEEKEDQIGYLKLSPYKFAELLEKEGFVETAIVISENKERE